MATVSDMVGIHSMSRHAAHLLCSFFLATVLMSPATAQVELRDVQAQGCGGDESSAMLEALQTALSLVGGMRLKVDMAMQVQETVRNDTVSIQSSFRQDVERATRGVIKSYRVVDTKVSSGSGQMCVTVVATIPSYRASEQLKRLKLAVIPVTVHPHLARDSNARKFADDVSAAMEAHLTGTRRFAMLDRRFGAQTQRELNSIISGATPIEDTVKLGLTAGADFIVLTSLRDFSSEVSEGRSPLGKPITRQIAPVAVDVRVIDIATRQIKYAQAYTNRGRLPPGYELSEHAKDIGHELGESVSTAIFPIAVLAVTGNMVTFNQGGDTVQVGRHYRLVVQGRKLVDPYTKESLGQEELEVGIAEVTSVTDRTSQARVISGKVAEGKGQLLARAASENFSGTANAGSATSRPMAGQAPSSGGAPVRPKGDDW